MSEAAGNGSARVALVTGANRGIGLEVCRQIARRDMTVILAAEGLAVLPKRLDVADDLTVDRLAAEVETDIGRLDVLVNNAGILYDTWQRIITADLDAVREALETNLLGAWRGVRGVHPADAEERPGADRQRLQRRRFPERDGRWNPRLRCLQGDPERP